MTLRSLSLLFSAAAIVFADTPLASKPAKGVSVAVIQGDAVTYNLPNPRTALIAIRVTDSTGKPIQNAVAVFEVPELGPSATLPFGSQVKVVLTDAEGHAAVELRSNGVPGHFEPKITVNYLGQTSTVTLKQENAFAPNVRPEVYSKAFTPKPPVLPRIPRTNNTVGRRISKKSVLILVGVAAAAGVGAMFAMHGGSSAPSSSSGGGITITPGTGSVGGH